MEDIGPPRSTCSIPEAGWRKIPYSLLDPCGLPHGSSPGNLQGRRENRRPSSFLKDARGDGRASYCCSCPRLQARVHTMSWKNLAWSGAGLLAAGISTLLIGACVLTTDARHHDISPVVGVGFWMA